LKDEKNKEKTVRRIEEFPENKEKFVTLNVNAEDKPIPEHKNLISKEIPEKNLGGLGFEKRVSPHKVEKVEEKKRKT